MKTLHDLIIETFRTAVYTLIPTINQSNYYYTRFVVVEAYHLPKSVLHGMS